MASTAPRRLVPTPVAASSSSAGHFSTTTHVAEPAGPHPDDSDGGASDDSEDDSAARNALQCLDEAGQQALIDAYFASKEAYDDAVAMLESGADERAPGDAGQAVTPERLAAERELLADLRAARREANEPLAGEEYEAAVAAVIEEFEATCLAMYETKADELGDAAQDVEHAGFCVVELERTWEQNRQKLVREACQEDEGEGEGGESGHEGGAPRRPCAKCLRPAELSAEGLCCVCAADKALDARDAEAGWQAVRHGKLKERGANGFQGWTEGLRRTSDKAALKRMYKTEKPDEFAGQLELQAADALEIDEVAGAEVAEQDAAASSDGTDDESDDGAASVFARMANGDKPSRRELRKAYAKEALWNVPINRRRGRKPAENGKGGGKGGAAAAARTGLGRRPECTSCRNPLYSCLEVHEHPLLGVAVCLHCYQRAGGATGGGATGGGDDDAGPAEGQAEAMEVDPASSVSADEICLWCNGSCSALGAGELFLCDAAGCNRAVCHGCVRLNLGPAELEAVTQADPWSCYACNPAPVAPLVQACKEERARRLQERERREKRAAAAAAAAAAAVAAASQPDADDGASPGRKRPHNPAASPAATAKAPRGASPSGRGANGPWSPTHEDVPAAADGGGPSRAVEALVLWPEAAPKRKDAGIPPLAAVSVHPRLLAPLKPHQAEGITFMWHACFAAKRADMSSSKKANREHGCVLAHSMGLGKTLSVIAFLHTALTRAKDGRGLDYAQYRGGVAPAAPPEGKEPRPSRALVVVPKAVVTQWEAEWRRWLGRSEEMPCWVLGPTSSQAMATPHLQSLRLWSAMGGLLIVSHDSFHRMLNPKTTKAAEKAAAQPFATPQEDLAEVEAHLLKPGPDILVVDEAHRIKNAEAVLTRALSRVCVEIAVSVVSRRGVLSTAGTLLAGTRGAGCCSPARRCRTTCSSTTTWSTTSTRASSATRSGSGASSSSTSTAARC